MKTIIVSTFLLATVAGPLSAAEFVSEKAHQFGADGIGKIQVFTGSGDINFEVWDESRIEVTILQSVKAKNEEKADSIFENTRVDIGESEGVLKVEVQHDSGGFWNNLLNADPDIVVTVNCPAEMDAEAAAGSGDVNLRGLAGSSRMSTGSGDVFGSNLAGEVNASTGSGDIILNGMRGQASANTGSGDVLIEQLEGNFSSGTGSGDIYATGMIAFFKAGTGSGDVEVRSTVVLAADSKVSTGSGDISVRLPANAGFDLYAETQSGMLECEFDLANLASDDDSLAGQANGSGPSLRLGAGSGDILVAKVQ